MAPSQLSIPWSSALKSRATCFAFSLCFTITSPRGTFRARLKWTRRFCRLTPFRQLLSPFCLWRVYFTFFLLRALIRNFGN
ncbi:hypothetical protein FB451DRAFT_1373282, partial [Mycena latifolia]